jgi:hypothetical protein
MTGLAQLHFDQLHLDVVMSAVLASAGGFVASRVNAAFELRRKQASAALICGEVLSAMQRIIRLAIKRHAETPGLCPVTIRLLHAARREINLYERNREQMFSLLDPDLRARAHTFMVRISIPLDHLFEDYQRVNTTSASDEEQSAMLAHMKPHLEDAFSSLHENSLEIPDLLKSLGPLAKDKFEGYSRIDVKGVPAPKGSFLRRITKRVTSKRDSESPVVLNADNTGGE